MSSTSHVVEGEASESETEIEVGKSPEILSPHSTEPFVIAGEAPESDDESRMPSVQSCAADAAPPSPASPLTTLMRTNYNSLLHQKLWECNVGLRATVEGLLRHTIDISVEKLSHADKTLLCVQESMRQTNANLTLARARLRQITTSLENANCAAALPTVKLFQ